VNTTVWTRYHESDVYPADRDRSPLESMAETTSDGSVMVVALPIRTSTSKASQAFWQVRDAEQEVAELKARGVSFDEFGGIVTAGGAKAAWFRDTEGNILAIVQSL